MSEKARLIRTPEEAFEAGRELCRRQGAKLTEAQAARIAAILRPYLARWKNGEAA